MDKNLRVTATYGDGSRDGTATTSATGVTMNTVRAAPGTGVNGSPGFSSAGDYTRTIPENTGMDMPVGAAVVASDPNDDPATPEDEDPLTYSLADVPLSDTATDPVVTATGDARFFKVDMSTGQLYVKMGLDYDNNADRAYEFYVRATDPSDAMGEVMVTVNVTDANDAPKIMGSACVNNQGQPIAEADCDTPTSINVVPLPDAPHELTVTEKDDDKGATPYNGGPDMMIPGIPGQMNVFTVLDEDVRGQPDWDLRGDDADDFELTNTSVDPTTGLRGPGEPITLRFAEAPDYENPTDANADSVYKVTLVVTDSHGDEDTRDLTIFVTNAYELGEVKLLDDQPLVGVPITAEVDDPDNGLAVVTWQWERSTAATGTTWMVIPGATTDTYTPRQDNPETNDEEQDDNGYFLRVSVTYTDMTSNRDVPLTVLVDERTQDAEDDPAVMNSDPEAKDATELDGSQEGSSKLYRVRVVSDNAVRIDPGTEKDVMAPEFAQSTFELMVVENAQTDSLVGAPVRVEPEKQKSFTYDLDSTVTNDDDYFYIATTTGQIRVGMVDFPNPVPGTVIDNSPTGTDDDPDDTDPNLNYEGSNTFSLIVTATDTTNPARKAMATVNITLADVNERPFFDKETRDRAVNEAEAARPLQAIEYKESRTNSVVPLAAVDPDVSQPDANTFNWEVTGPDADDFMIMDADDINDGKDRVELRFKSQPNFESPTDRAWDLDANGTVAETDGVLEDRRNNNYYVTVRATETSAVGGGPNMAAELDFMITVMNAEEKGSITMNLLQPEVNTDLVATISDPDGGVDQAAATWSWYRAKVRQPNTPGTTEASLENEWEPITAGFTNGTYNNEDEDNEGWHLLARAVYTDTEAADKAAVGMSMFATRADVLDPVNNSPDFLKAEDTRSVDENAAVGGNVGAPVVVTTEEDGDILTYSLDDDADSDAPDANTDVDFFSIDPATGQITVKKTLSAEETDGRDYDDADDDDDVAGTYVVYVRAIDPSGEADGDDRDEIEITITANDVNEAPGVMGMVELSLNEVDSSKKDSDVTKFVGLGYELFDDDSDDATPGIMRLMAGNPNLYHRTEEDTVDRATWPDRPIAGPDGRLFEYSIPADGIGRRLHFKNMYLPDFENPMDANRDNLYEVTITVEDTEGDTGMKNVRITVMNVDEAGKLVITPQQPDDKNYVTATLTDPDGVVTITNWRWAATDTMAESFTLALGTVDGDGVFPNEIPLATTDMWMGEVGEFLWAMVEYRDGYSMVDDLYTALDERNDNPATADTVESDFDSDHMDEAAADNAVQSAPEDPDDPDRPVGGVEELALMVNENVPSTGYVGMPIDDLGMRDTIGGPDGANFVFAEEMDAETDNYYDEPLRRRGFGDDPDTIDVDESMDKGGQLALKAVTKLDAEGAKNTYVIEISDPDTETDLTIYRITINVVDVNDPPTAPSEQKGLPAPLNTDPMFAATSTTFSVDENAAAGTVVGMVMATDADRGDQETLMYSLDDGADAGSFAIDSATGEITTTAMLDYEMQDSYMVTVTATDDDEATAMIYVTIMVNDRGLDNAYDMDEDGTISRDEVIEAIRDFLFTRTIDREQVIEVIRLYLTG